MNKLLVHRLLFFFCLSLVFAVILKASFVSLFHQINVRNNQNVKIINEELLLPFCESKGEISKSDLVYFFSKDFIFDHESNELNGRENSGVNQTIKDYESLFLEYTKNSNCINYFKQITPLRFTSHYDEYEQKSLFGQYRYEYRLPDGLVATLFLTREDSKFKISVIAMGLVTIST